MTREQRWTGVSGLAGFVVFTVGNALWALDQPAPDAPAAELVAFYTDASGRIVAGGLISLLSIAIFVVFAAGLRAVLAELDGDGLLADAAFGGLLVGLAAGIGAESINVAAALRAGDDALTEDLALALFDVSYMFGSYGAGIGFGVATLALGVATLRSGTLLPRWLAAAAIAIGIAMVTPLFGVVLGEWTVGPSLLLFAVLGVLLLMRPRR
jgi:hypothetical protein